MKVYEAIFKEGETEGVYALSVVENPAMEDFWITLSEHPQKLELQLADEKKRLLLGAALIPNKKIYRNIDGNEFYITFSEETIEKLAHNFFKEQMNNNSSLEHEVKLEGMSVVEGWIVEDTLKDKSANYGKEYPKGTFVTMMKVDNDEMWDKALKGEIKGFSIDALLGLQEVKFKTDINMNEEAKKSFLTELKEDIRALFTTQKEEVETQATEAEAEVVEETQEEAFDAEAFKNEIKEALGVEFKNQLETFKAELSAELAKKDETITELETKLAKQPEKETVIDAPKQSDIQLNKQGTILEILRTNK